MTERPLRRSPSGRLLLFDTDQVDNSSAVPGASLSDALDAIDGDLPVSTSDLSNLSAIPGATVTQALNAIANPVTAARIAPRAVTLAKLAGGGVLLSLGATNPSATNATTNLSCGALTLPAGTVTQGTTFRAYMDWAYVHAAGATPTLTIEWVLGGAALLAFVITPNAVAATYNGLIEAYFRFSSNPTTSGIARFNIKTSNTVGATVTDQLGGSAANQLGGINTSITTTLELRIRMTTAVASNTLTLNQAYLERLIIT